MLAQQAGSAAAFIAQQALAAQDYMYEVLDRDTVPGGRSIWIIDMKGEATPMSSACLRHKHVLRRSRPRGAYV